jgi:hypothetical protein
VKKSAGATTSDRSWSTESLSIIAAAMNIFDKDPTGAPLLVEDGVPRGS